MAYSFQTFSIGQIFTAAQANAIEANIRDHVHGVAGVSSSGMTFVSPVFTTQITTPKIVTASGILEVLPAGNAHVILQGSGTGNVGIGVTPTAKIHVLQSVDNVWAGSFVSTAATAGQSYGLTVTAGTNSSDMALRVESKSSALYLAVLGNGNTGFKTVAPTAAVHLPISTTGAPSTGPLKFTLASTVVLGTPEAGVLEPDSTGALYFTNSSAARKTIAFTDVATLSSLTTIGTLVAGTVPLARMGTVALNSSVAVNANSDTAITISTTDQAHEFYSYSVYNSTNTTDTGYSAIVSPSETIYDWFHTALVHAKTVGRALRLCNGSAASITAFYKVYKLTET